jgi:hypothetical protein
MICRDNLVDVEKIVTAVVSWLCEHPDKVDMGF